MSESRKERLPTGQFAPGNPGRPEGPNKVTKATREAFQLLVERNFDSLQTWIEQTAAQDPAKAFSMVMDLASFCIPRLKAIEITGEVTMPTVTIIRPTNGVPIP